MHVQSQSVDRSDFLMKLKRPKRYLMITGSLKSITTRADSAMNQSRLELRVHQRSAGKDVGLVTLHLVLTSYWPRKRPESF